MAWSRRQFLRTVGAAGAASVLFPWTEARAGEPTRRLILFYTPHGTIYDAWRPIGGETGFLMSRILKPLERHRKQLVVLDGVGMHSPYSRRVPHTYDFPALWTGSPIDTTASLYERVDHGVTFGWNTGTSIDQHLAQRLNPKTLFRTLELGVACGGAHPARRMIYSGPAAPRNPLADPRQAWDQIFGGLDGGAAASRRKRAVMDAVHGDLARIKRDLSTADQVRLDAHATSLREIEASLNDSEGPDCDGPARPTGGGLDTIIDQQSGLLAASIACGLTTIASLQVRIADNDSSLYPWVGMDRSGHHPISHGRAQPDFDLLTALYTWYAERFAHLLDLLANLPDGDGTSVLDNSMVVWGSEIGRGWDHKIDKIPFVIAGGAAGSIGGDRYLVRTGLKHNRLLVSMAHAMGVTDIQTYGSTDRGSGGVPGLVT